MIHDSKITHPKPPVEAQRIGAVGSILTLVGGFLALTLIASVNQALAVIVAASVIVLAVAVFLFTLFRKN